MDLRYADQHTNAVLEAWYPGAEGGTALADILFGKVSPSGKLPVTFYYDTDDLPEFTDYSMENRTYRYMKKEALYRKDCKYKTELLNTVKEYVQFYNYERPHTALGYKTPVQFEDQYFQGLSVE